MGLEIAWRGALAHYPRRCALLVFAAVGLAVLFGVLTSTAGDLGAVRENASGPLDGMVFVGRIGHAGNLDFPEELHFNNGRFWSNNCVLCGYHPGAYLTRKVGTGIEFQSTLTRGNSTFRYSGLVEGDRVRVAVRWTKHRWYWSIDQQLVFDGTLAPARPAVGAQEAQNEADAARSNRTPPPWCT